MDTSKSGSTSRRLTSLWRSTAAAAAAVLLISGATSTPTMVHAAVVAASTDVRCVELAKVQTIIFEQGTSTTTRRRSPNVPRLVCEGPSCESLLAGTGTELQRAVCRNRGLSDDGSVAWQCRPTFSLSTAASNTSTTAVVDGGLNEQGEEVAPAQQQQQPPTSNQNKLRLSRIRIQCEGCERAGDSQVAHGSCSLRYSVAEVSALNDDGAAGAPKLGRRERRQRRWDQLQRGGASTTTTTTTTSIRHRHYSGESDLTGLTVFCIIMLVFCVCTRVCRRRRHNYNNSRPVPGVVVSPASLAFGLSNYPSGNYPPPASSSSLPPPQPLYAAGKLNNGVDCGGGSNCAAGAYPATAAYQHQQGTAGSYSTTAGTPGNVIHHHHHDDADRSGRAYDRGERQGFWNGMMLGTMWSGPGWGWGWGGWGGGYYHGGLLTTDTTTTTTTTMNDDYHDDDDYGGYGGGGDDWGGGGDGGWGGGDGFGGSDAI